MWGSSPSSLCVGSNIVNYQMHYLKLYKSYVQNFSNAMAVIERVERKKDVANFFEVITPPPSFGYKYVYFALLSFI